MADPKDPNFDPYHKWLGIPKTMRPPTHYQILGLTFGESDVEVIEEAAIRQSTHLRTYQIGPHAELCTKLLNEVGRARQVLLNPVKREEYNRRLTSSAAPAPLAAPTMPVAQAPSVPTMPVPPPPGWPPQTTPFSPVAAAPFVPPQPAFPVEPVENPFEDAVFETGSEPSSAPNLHSRTTRTGRSPQRAPGGGMLLPALFGGGAVLLLVMVGVVVWLIASSGEKKPVPIAAVHPPRKPDTVRSVEAGIKQAVVTPLPSSTIPTIPAPPIDTIPDSPPPRPKKKNQKTDNDSIPTTKPKIDSIPESLTPNALASALAGEWVDVAAKNRRLHVGRRKQGDWVVSHSTVVNDVSIDSARGEAAVLGDQGLRYQVVSLPEAPDPSPRGPAVLSLSKPNIVTETIDVNGSPVVREYARLETPADILDMVGGEWAVNLDGVTYSVRLMRKNNEFIALMLAERPGLPPVDYPIDHVMILGNSLALDFGDLSKVRQSVRGPDLGPRMILIPSGNESAQAVFENYQGKRAQTKLRRGAPVPVASIAPFSPKQGNPANPSNPASNLVKVAGPSSGPQIHVVGVYEGKPAPNARPSLDKVDPGTVKINIVAGKDEPMILVVNSWKPVRWEIDDPKGAVVKVIASGYYKQEILGLPESVPVVGLFQVTDKEFFNSFRMEPDKTRPKGEQEKTIKDFNTMSAKVKALTGQDVAFFQGKYQGDEFTVPDPAREKSPGDVVLVAEDPKAKTPEPKTIEPKVVANDAPKLLTVSKLVPVDFINALTLNDVQPGAMEISRAYPIELKATKLYEINLFSDQFDVYLMLQRDGKTSRTDFDASTTARTRNAKIRIRPSSDYEFTIVVTSRNRQSIGRFRLTVEEQ